MEANSDALTTSLAVLTERTEKNQVLIARTKRNQMLASKRSKKGYIAVDGEDLTGDGKIDDPLALSKLSLKSRKGRNELMELVTLHKGVSPEGVPYRLSPVFTKYPDAVVGRKRFNISVLGDYKFEVSGNIINRHLPVLHWFCPDFELECRKEGLSFPRKDNFSHIYSQLQKDARWAFLSSRLLVVVSIFAVIYCGKANEAANSALHAGTDELQHLSSHEKEKVIADAKAASQVKAGYTQLVALLIGTFVTFVTFAYPDVMVAYGEKEEERLEELKDQNKEESKEWLGLKKYYDKFLWYTDAQHRYFGVDAVWEGGSFMYASEVGLLLLLIVGHPASPIQILPTTLCAWLLIMVTFGTLMRLNAAFLVEQSKKVVKMASTAEERLVAEYENYLKKAHEVIEQVKSYPKKMWGKVEDVIDQFKGYLGMASAAAERARELQAQAEAAAAAVNNATSEAGLNAVIEEKSSLSGPLAGMTVLQRQILLEPDSAEQEAAEKEGKSWFGGKSSTASNAVAVPLLENAASTGAMGSSADGGKGRANQDKFAKKRKELEGKMGYSRPDETCGAEVYKYMGDSKKKEWEDYTSKLAYKQSWLDDKYEEQARFMEEKPVVIQGSKAHSELKAVTGLARTDPVLKTYRKGARLFYKGIVRTLCAPCLLLMRRSIMSPFIKFVLTPIALWYLVIHPLFFWGDLGMILHALVFALGMQACISLYKYGVKYAETPEEELQATKEAEKLKEIEAEKGEKVMSVHKYSVLRDNFYFAEDELKHVESALRATEGVDSSWARGECRFVKLPPELVDGLRKPVPDVNKGYFSLNTEKIGHYSGAVSKALAPWEKRLSKRDIEEAEFRGRSEGDIADITEQLERETMLESDNLFNVKDYVFDYSDLIIDTLGIRLRSEMKGVRHSKPLSKKLLEVNKPASYSRELVKSFPVQVDLEWFYPAGSDIFLTGTDDEDKSAAEIEADRAQSKDRAEEGGDGGEGAAGPKEAGIAPEKQVVCTLQVINFVGKGSMDCPENDSYLTLTQEAKHGAGKKGGVDLSRFTRGSTVCLQDLKVGDMWEVFPAESGGGECFEVPRLSDNLYESLIAKINNKEAQLKPENIEWHLFDKKGRKATKKNVGRREGSHQAAGVSPNDSGNLSNVSGASKASKTSSHSNNGDYWDHEGVYHRNWKTWETPEDNVHQISDLPLYDQQMLANGSKQSSKRSSEDGEASELEGQGAPTSYLSMLKEGDHNAAAPLFTASDEHTAKVFVDKSLNLIQYEHRPADEYWSHKEARITQVYDTCQETGKPLPPKQVRLRLKIKDNKGLDRDFTLCPVIPGSAELLCRLDSDESLEESKARQVASWFKEIEGWLGDLGASTNRRSNSHKLFDSLFWGVEQDTDAPTNGGKPETVEGYKNYLRTGKAASEGIMEKQRGLFQRILEYKDGGYPVGGELVSFNQSLYTEYLMYGNETDGDWPGFIHWFRKAKKKATGGKAKKDEDLNKNPKFHSATCKNVPDPGVLVECLSKPTLTPSVLHVVLTDGELRAPGDVVESWAPQRGEPHPAELFHLSSRLDNTGSKSDTINGVCGLLKLFPSKIVFETPSGDGEFGDLQSMSDEVNIDFSDIYIMSAQIDDVFHPENVSRLLVPGKTLYIQKKSGSVVAFGMSEEKIRMWNDLIKKFEMDRPYQVCGTI